MDYRLRVGDEICHCKLEGGEEKTVRITIEGRVATVRYVMVSDYHIHLIVDGNTTRAFVAGSNDEKTVVIEGIPYSVQNEDMFSQAASRRKGPRSVPRQVTPPMPSVVVRIMVLPGDVVQEGDGVVVVMAMKMEATLTAPYDGRIRKINVAVGDKVMPGQILVDIDKEEATAA
jgi:biotin carboxyl carrier protein